MSHPPKPTYPHDGDNVKSVRLLILDFRTSGKKCINYSQEGSLKGPVLCHCVILPCLMGSIICWLGRGVKRLKSWEKERHYFEILQPLPSPLTRSSLFSWAVFQKGRCGWAYPALLHCTNSLKLLSLLFFILIKPYKLFRLLSYRDRMVKFNGWIGYLQTGI